MDIIDWEKIGKTFFMAAFIICVIIGIYGMVHIAYNEKNDKIVEASLNSRFEIIETMITPRMSSTIVYDKQTKVMYSVSKDGVFTVLVDKDRNPITYKGE